MRIRLNYGLLVLLLCSAFTSLARAGGGGHGGGSGGHGFGGSGGHSFGGGWHSSGSSSGADFLGTLFLIGLVAAVFIAYHWQTNTNAVRTKQQAAERLLAMLAQEDALWNLQHITARVEEIYFKVQAAWTANNQDLARDCMSERLYHKHKEQTDRYLATGQRNILKAITLQNVIIYSVSDHKNNNRDTFSAQITGAMIDYMVDKHGAIIAGNASYTEEFTETWKFMRFDNQWVLDRITASASSSIIERGVTYSHKLRRKPHRSARS